MIVIVDYKMGNINSIKNKLRQFNINVEYSNEINVISKADKLILPGVGNFSEGMKNIKNLGLIEILNKKVLDEKTPIMGICLGAQLFANYSEEGNCNGLGWIDANIKKFKLDPIFKIPNIGWSKIIIKKSIKYFNNIDINNIEFYFIHSYFIKCNNMENVIATSYYGKDFDAVIGKDNIFGTQFHPEKSHKSGFQLLLNFCVM